MANLGYIQVVRHCNHHCGFCSNPKTPHVHTFESMRALVDDLVERDYYGVILTGGEPCLHPELPRICAYARERGLQTRMITNGTRLSEAGFAEKMAQSGLELVHISVYSVRPGVEAGIRGIDGTLERACAAAENSHQYGIAVNINCVINKLNADHLDENVRFFIDRYPYIRHFVWNNLDPTMGRAAINRERYTPRLSDFELSLKRALSLLQETGRTFRVEKVPLCYMAEFAWASTETRKIVKNEERMVFFLDEKRSVHQTEWNHVYCDVCDLCRVRAVCGGLFAGGDGYDTAELHPIFVDPDAIAKKINRERSYPGFRFSPPKRE